MQLPPGRRVTGLDRDRALELADGLVDLVPLDVDASQVEVGEVARLVPTRRLGALEPVDRLLLPAQLDQVGADVVVGVAEVRIERNRHLALGDGVLVAPEIAERPTEECVRFSRRTNGDGRAIVLDGFVQTTSHLRLVSAPEMPVRFLWYVARHAWMPGGILPPARASDRKRRARAVC